MRNALIVMVIAGTLAPTGAVAGEARASGNVPVRDGPGTRHEVIGNLIDDASYEVEDCTRQANWCLVSSDGDLVGWVRGSYLIGSGAKAAVTPPEFFDPFDMF